MTKQRTGANDTAKPDTLSAQIAAQIDTVEIRIATFAKWFDIDPPSIECDPDDPEGGPLLTNELYPWLIDQDASFDWVFIGDPKGMAIEYRKQQLDKSGLMKSFDRLDETEQKMFVIAVRSFVDGLVPLEQALGLVEKEIEAYRATLSGAKNIAREAA